MGVPSAEGQADVPSLALPLPTLATVGVAGSQHEGQRVLATGWWGCSHPWAQKSGGGTWEGDTLPPGLPLAVVLEGSWVGGQVCGRCGM